MIYIIHQLLKMSSSHCTDEYTFPILVNNRDYVYVSLNDLQKRTGLFAYDETTLDMDEYRIRHKANVCHVRDFFRYVLNKDSSALSVKNANTFYNLCREFKCLQEQEKVTEFMKQQDISVLTDELISASPDEETCLLEDTLSQCDSVESLISNIGDRRLLDLDISRLRRYLEKILSRHGESRALKEVVDHLIVSILRKRGEEGIALLDLANWECFSASNFHDMSNLDVIQKCDPCVFVRFSHLRSLHERQSSLESRLEHLESKFSSLSELVTSDVNNVRRVELAISSIEKEHKQCVATLDDKIRSTQESLLGRVSRSETSLKGEISSVKEMQEASILSISRTLDENIASISKTLNDQIKSVEKALGNRVSNMESISLKALKEQVQRCVQSGRETEAKIVNLSEKLEQRIPERKLTEGSNLNDMGLGHWICEGDTWRTLKNIPPGLSGSFRMSVSLSVSLSNGNLHLSCVWQTLTAQDGRRWSRLHTFGTFPWSRWRLQT